MYIPIQRTDRVQTSCSTPLKRTSVEFGASFELRGRFSEMNFSYKSMDE